MIINSLLFDKSKDIYYDWSIYEKRKLTYISKNKKCEVISQNFKESEYNLSKFNERFYIVRRFFFNRKRDIYFKGKKCKFPL